ncbi:hypothetical protein SCOR_20440 [Sulfidibacter corallicola]
MKKTAGRPMKYAPFLLALDDDQVYSPATIVRHGEEKGILEPWGDDPEDYRRLKIKIRHSLARFSKNHGFPDEGDGIVTLAGQAPTRGWLGSRWKEAVPERHKATKASKPLKN